MGEAEVNDLHLGVLQDAFLDLKTRQQPFIVNRVFNFNKDILLLFSPFIRDIIFNLPPNACMEAPSLLIPDVDVKTVMKVQELLQTGYCWDMSSIMETKELFEACRTLGIDVTKLYFGKDSVENPNEEMNIHMEDVDNNFNENFRQRRNEGREVAFLFNANYSSPDHDGNAAEPPVPDQPPSSDERTAAPSAIQIKKEKVTVAEETPSNRVNAEESEPMDQSSPPEANEKVNQDPAPAAVVTPKLVPVSGNQCEKCKSQLASIPHLKRHYVGHFLSFMKKKYAGTAYKDDKCLECSKVFPRIQDLMTHLAVQHDKINPILKMKGYKELPLSSTLAKEKPDVKNIPTFQPKQPPQSMPKPAPVSKSQASPAAETISPPGPPPPALCPPQTPVRQSAAAAQSPVPPASEKKRLDDECNFNQECQVCKQKEDSIEKLQQHLCRHFMKEIADQFESLMDTKDPKELKCTICRNGFKARHSLVLHIGCKHGKINDILKQKGFLVLPAPILNRTSNNMQKQLQQVKKEKMDTGSTSAEDGAVKETLNEATPNVAALLQAPTVAPSSLNLEEILKKYNVKDITAKSSK